MLNRASRTINFLQFCPKSRWIRKMSKIPFPCIHFPSIPSDSASLGHMSSQRDPGSKIRTEWSPWRAAKGLEKWLFTRPSNNEFIQGDHLRVSLSLWQFIHRKVAKGAEWIFFFICGWDAGKWKPTYLRQFKCILVLPVRAWFYSFSPFLSAAGGSAKRNK